MISDGAGGMALDEIIKRLVEHTSKSVLSTRGRY